MSVRPALKYREEAHVQTLGDIWWNDDGPLAECPQISYLPANAARQIFDDKSILGARRWSVSIIVVVTVKENFLFY